MYVHKHILVYLLQNTFVHVQTDISLHWCWERSIHMHAFMYICISKGIYINTYISNYTFTQIHSVSHLRNSRMLDQPNSIFDDAAQLLFSRSSSRSAITNTPSMPWAPRAYWHFGIAAVYPTCSKHTSRVWPLGLPTPPAPMPCPPFGLGPCQEWHARSSNP